MNVSIFVHSFRYYSLSAVVLIHITVTGLIPLRNNQDIDSTCTENDSIPCEKVVNAQQETSDITVFAFIYKVLQWDQFSAVHFCQCNQFFATFPCNA